MENKGNRSIGPRSGLFSIGGVLLYGSYGTAPGPDSGVADAPGQCPADGDLTGVCGCGEYLSNELLFLCFFVIFFSVPCFRTARRCFCKRRFPVYAQTKKTVACAVISRWNRTARYRRAVPRRRGERGAHPAAVRRVPRGLRNEPRRFAARRRKTDTAIKTERCAFNE